MSIKAAWQCLSVDDFISKCNWENIFQKPPANSVVPHQKSLKSWQCLTAQNFFRLNNWSGQNIVANLFELPGISHEIPVFDLTFTPDQFWQCFNWSKEHSPSLAEKRDQAIEEAEEVIEAVEEFTLKDLSQLF